MNKNDYREFQLQLIGLEWALYSFYHEREKGRYIHSSLGHELAAFITTSVIKADEASWIFYYRSHAWLLGLGISLQEIINEIKGGEKSRLKGKGGAMNLFLNARIIDCNSIIGAQIPVAVGAAFANRSMGLGTICVLGDGATNTGVFFESLNIVSLQKLPLLLVIENNEISINSAYENTSTVEIRKKVELFSIRCFEVSDSNFQDAYTTFSEALSLSKTEPVAIIFHCHRLGAHAVSMMNDFEETIGKYNLSPFEKNKIDDIRRNCLNMIADEK